MAERRIKISPYWHVTAFGLYLCFSVLFLSHGVSLTQNILGTGSDPFGFIWFLDWWPWSIMHHQNPFWTNLVWQPTGVVVLWASSIPFLSLIGLPLTLKLGPIFTFNVLVLMAPVLAAWCAYLLCVWITRNPGAAIIGGYIFGFSSYEMAQASTLNLSFSFLVPCLVWVILARIKGEMSKRVFIGLTCFILVFEFLISTEIFAMVIFFSGFAYCLAFIVLPRFRHALSQLFIDGLLILPLVGLALTPFLLSMFMHYPFIHLPEMWPYFFSADALGYILPAQGSLFGGFFTKNLINNFYGDFQEQDSYVGPLLILIVFLYLKKNWHQDHVKFLFLILMVLAIASLGPQLWVAGIFTKLVLPWSIIMRLPLLGGALPVRFAMYVTLAIAIISALWIAEPAPPAKQYRRIGLAIIACIMLMPRLHPSISIPNSTFFQRGRVQEVLGQNQRIMILPFSINGPSSFWQEESDFSFAQTGGYLGFPPAAMQKYDGAMSLFMNDYGPNFLHDFTEFANATNTQYIVAGPGTSTALLAKLAELNWPMRKVDDVLIFTVPTVNPESAAHG